MAVLFGYLGVLVIIGALLCFKGRDLFRPAIAIFAFWLVYSLVMGALKGADQKDLIIAVLAGLVAALLSGFVLKIGVFLAGMVTGISLGSLAFDMIPQIRDLAIPRVVFLIVVTILVAVLTEKAIDVLIMIATAGIGAILIAVPCVYMVFDFHHFTQNIVSVPAQTMQNVNNAMFVRVATQQPLVVLVAVVVLMIAGILVQHKTNHKRHGE